MNDLFLHQHDVVLSATTMIGHADAAVKTVTNAVGGMLSDNKGHQLEDPFFRIGSPRAQVGDLVTLTTSGEFSRF
ncbi:hypothetical protein [Xanthomonas arboricola]|uniref:hypothetical protein n=1 Tax=Xanthomonas arboricola TaxID=56448 RepID=UPI003EBB9932